MVGFGPAREDYPEYQRIRAGVLVGRSDEEIARALTLSVKVIRVVRREVETEVRSG